MTPTPKNIVTYRKAAGLKLHDQNPRFIRDRQFEILCQSLRDNPDYFEVRPILCTPDGQVFAGNMRLRAAREIGLKEVPVVVMDIPDERVRELMIRDNVQNGEWEAEALTNNFDAEQLAEWGLEMPDFTASPSGSINPDELPDAFSLADGDRAPFQQMTFTLADAQATEIKAALKEMQQSEGFEYAETHGNENSNGNALFLIIRAWAGQKTLC